MTKLFIATPAKPAWVHATFVGSLIGSLDALREAGIDARFGMFTNALIGRARAGLVAQFMASPATHMLFVDADMSWNSDAPRRLLAHDVDFVAAVAAERAGAHAEMGGPWGWHDSNLLKVESVGFGFVMLRRAAFEKMFAAHPELKAPAYGEFFYALFQETLSDGKLWDEDTSFCQRWRALGETIYVDPTIPLGHTVDCNYEFRLADHMPGSEAAA